MNDINAEIEHLKTEIASIARKLEDLSGSQMQSENGGSHYRDRYDSLKQQLRGKLGGAMEATRRTGKKVAGYAEDNPWQLAAAVIVVGVVAGLLFWRQSEEIEL